MSDLPNAEQRIYYNVSPSENDASVDDPRYFNLQPGLERPDFHEMKAVTACILQLGSHLGIEEKDLYFNLGMEDRTAAVFPGTPSELNAKFVLSVQSMVLKQHPLWRVIVPLGNPEDSFVIYPDEVVFVNSVAPLEDALAEVQRRELQHDDATKGAHERQRAWVQILLRRMRKPQKPFSPILVCSFDNASGEPEYRSLWFLENIPIQNWFDFEEKPLRDGYYACESVYDVNESGDICDSRTSKQHHFCNLTSQCFKTESFNGTVCFKHSDTGKFHTIESAELLSDQDVKGLLTEIKSQISSLKDWS